MNQSHRSLVFTVSARYWLIYLAAPALILFLTGLLLWTPGFPIWLPLALFAAAVVYPVVVWYRQRGNRVDVLPDRVRVLTGRYAFEVFWKDVQAVSHTRTGFKRGITFYLADGSEFLAGRTFDFERMLHQIQLHLPLAVQDPLAYQRLGPYQSWRTAMAARFEFVNGYERIDIGFGQRMFGLFCLIGGGWLVREAALGIAALAYPAVFLLLLGLYLIVDSLQWLAVDALGLKISTPFSHYHLPWNELQKIVFNPDTHTYALMNRHTCLVLPTPHGWVGANRKNALEWIRYRIHTSGIVPLEQTRAVLLHNRQELPRRRRHAVG